MIQTVDMTSPSICSDGPFCVTFDYVIPLSIAELSVLTQCEGKDWGPAVVFVFNTTDKNTWKKASITFDPCPQSDTKVHMCIGAYVCSSKHLKQLIISSFIYRNRWQFPTKRQKDKHGAYIELLSTEVRGNSDRILVLSACTSWHLSVNVSFSLSVSVTT